MDNTSIPSTADALLASSNALQQSTPLQSPDKKRILKQGSKAPAPVGTLLSEVQGKEVRWLWQRRLPLGKLTTLDGDLCLGKSYLALDIAGRVSSGQEMPDSTPGIAGVVLIAPDDGLADTIYPRLQGGRSSPPSRTGGSIAFTSAACSELMVLKDPTDESKRVLAHVTLRRVSQTRSF
jgi:hypothetical protein